MSLKINVRNFCIGVIFIILLFITCLESMTNIVMLQFIFKHIDEVITVAFLLYVLLYHKIAFRRNKRICELWSGILFIGLFSNLVFQYQNIVAVLTDAFILCSRFIIGYLTIDIYCYKRNKPISDSLEKLVKIITIVLFFLALHDTFLSPFFQKSEYRYFMYSIQLMFPHVTYLSYAGATLLIFLGYKGKKHNNIIFMLMASYLCFVTLRSKAIGFLFFYWIFFLITNVFKKKHLVFMIFCGIIGVLFVAWDQIELSYFTETRFSPRSILLRDGIRLMIQNIPLGTGFGTFATSMAATYYSPLYMSLGYQVYRGMSATDSMFLSDSFWPAVFAQFGLIGTILFWILVFNFVQKALKKYKYDKNGGFSMLMIFVYMLITSMAESAFFNPAALLMIMLFAIFETENRQTDITNLETER